MGRTSGFFEHSVLPRPQPVAQPLAARQEKLTPEQAFGRVLARTRRDRCLSQEKLADLSGCSRSYVSLLETGRYSPSLALLLDLARALDVTIRHHFLPNWRRRRSGRLIVMQPWEYGYLPRSWVEGSPQEACWTRQSASLTGPRRSRKPLEGERW